MVTRPSAPSNARAARVRAPRTGNARAGDPSSAGTREARTAPAPETRPAGIAEARPSLTPERIHATALALVDQDGLDALTMRRLAAELRVDPMSIYHHVPNKRALLQGVFERVLRELPIPRTAGMSWQDVLRAFARRFHALARRHPKVMPALLASPHASPREREIHAAIDLALARAGFGDDDRIRLGQAIYTFASGLAGVAAQGPGGRPLHGGSDRASDSDVRRTPRTEGKPRRVRSDPAADLEFSIELMIAGIESIARRRSHRQARRLPRPAS